MKQDSEKVAKKRLAEAKIMATMVRIYCKGNHKTKEGLCEECEALLAYANKRTELCPFMEQKTFCANCKVHCYKPDMKQKVKDVMRYAGPRMLFVRPDLVVKHVYYGRKNRSK
ncbi:hypothetical protein lbkm_2153 [Lachnospiraceae bacterium KM106-2]|nr:hypothetical protein lbkm_2153 [Lachnospiraceae bacterium KM106-2]